MINEPAREKLDSSSLIGHVATNTNGNILDSGVLKILLSDHYLIFSFENFGASFSDNANLSEVEE